MLLLRFSCYTQEPLPAVHEHLLIDVPCKMQVITEPGADESLRNHWEGKLVYAEGADGIAAAIQHYIGDEAARLARQKISWDLARSTYALSQYIGAL